MRLLAGHQSLPGRVAAAISLMLILAAGTTITIDASHADERGKQERYMAEKPRERGAGSTLRGENGRPYAEPGRNFTTLDEYLAHRAFTATIGAPALREISPGRYIEEAADGQVRHYTRQQLMKMHGFTR